MTAQTKPLPRGIRNHNPGNIERNADRWQGMTPHQPDARFVSFVSAEWGIRALARTLITYYDQRRASDGSRLDTVRKIIARWAPPSENNTAAYANAVAAALRVRPDDVIDVHQYPVMRDLVRAIIRHENGPGPYYGHWYNDGVIDHGLRLAGIAPAQSGGAA